MSFVKLEKKHDYALLCIMRPEALNAINAEVLADISAALKTTLSQEDTRALILYGAGKKAFAAGADIAAMQEMSVENLRSFLRLGSGIFDSIAQANLITIAAINGFALGGGLELALACDLRLAADSAQMALPEVGLGLIPAFGGTQRLPRMIGASLALEMILSGERIGAARAREIGLVNHVYPQDSFMEHVESFVQKLLAKKSHAAQSAARRALWEGLALNSKEGLEKEQSIAAKLAQAHDYQEGCAAFLEKRPPLFRAKADF